MSHLLCNAKDVPEYTLDVKTEGNVVTITLMQDGKAVGKVGTITLPKVETPDIPESFDPSKLTVRMDIFITMERKLKQHCLLHLRAHALSWQSRMKVVI